MVRSKTKTTLFLLLLLCFTADAWRDRRRRRRSRPSPPADTTPPSFKNCRSPWTVTTPTSSATVTWNEPTGFEQYNLYEGIRLVECPDQQCFGERQVPTSRSGPPPGSTFREGQHSIVYTAIDDAGNTARCTISFRVEMVKCSPLRSPVNGRITECSREGSLVPVTSLQPFNTTCSISCDTGYTLTSGPSSRTCLTTGQWDGQEIFCTVRRCPVIVPPENALPSNCGGTPGNLATSGSVCTFYCPHGFNPRGHDTVECQADGTWSEASFACEVEFESDRDIFEAGLTDQGNGNSLRIINDHSTGDGSGNHLDNFEWDLTDQGSGGGLGIINEDSTNDGSGSGRDISDADITEQGSDIVLEDEQEDDLGDYNTEHESDSDIYFVQQ